MTMATRIAVMNHGLLQQIDNPQNLYDRPDNIFVAGFIGSPAMNFFDATLRMVDGKVMVDSDSFQVEVPGDRTAVLAPHAGKPVVFGIRPEDIHNPEFAPQSIFAQAIDARVDVTELMGNEIFVFLNSGKHDFVARVDPRSCYSMGDQARVVFNMDNMHIFDKATEQAIR
jgi:multiple sugar transport system ATP-binding protein